MFEIKITDDQYSRTQELLNLRPVYSNSHRKFQGNEVGFLGEIIFLDYLKANGIYFKIDDETSHDISLFNSRKVEIKTKDRTVIPKSHYECSIPLYNHSHQRAHYYVFLSLLRDKNESTEKLKRFKYAYILGFANKELMRKYGVLWKAGDVDPSNGTRFWTSCVNIKIENLLSLETFTKFYKDKSA